MKTPLQAGPSVSVQIERCKSVGLSACVRDFLAIALYVKRASLFLSALTQHFCTPDVRAFFPHQAFSDTSWVCPTMPFQLLGSVTRAVRRTQAKSLLVRVLIYYKGCSSVTVRWQRGMGQDMGMAFGASMPGTPPSQCLYVLTYPEALQTLGVSVFYIGASLHRHEGLHHWPLVINSTSSPCLLFPEVRKWG